MYSNSTYGTFLLFVTLLLSLVAAGDEINLKMEDTFTAL